MTPTESSKHNARRQTLKTTEHLREARQTLTLAFEHLKLIRNCGKVKGLEAVHDKATNYGAALDALYSHLNIVFNKGVDLANEIKTIMEQPDHTPPPIVGRYLNYTDLTPLQRALIREGHEEIAKNSRNALPKHYYNKADHEPRQPKVIAPIKFVPAKKRIPDSRMPL